MGIVFAMILSVSLVGCGSNQEALCEQSTKLIHDFVTLLAKEDLSETVYVYEKRNEDDHFEDYYEMSGKVEGIDIQEMVCYEKENKLTLAVHLKIKTEAGTGYIKTLIESDKEGKELTTEWKDNGAEFIFQQVSSYDKAMAKKGKYGDLIELEEDQLKASLDALVKKKEITFSNAHYLNSDDPSLVGSDVNGPVVCPYQSEEGNFTISLHYDKAHFLTGLVINMSKDMGFEIDPSSLPAARDATLAEFKYTGGLDVNVSVDTNNNQVVNFAIILDLATYDFENDPVGLLANVGIQDEKIFTSIPVALLAKEFEAQGSGACTNLYE